MTDPTPPHGFNQPLGGNEMPRFGGPATMMRLPAQADARGLDAAFVGVPLDIGTSNRPGTRFGPRQIRDDSRMLRPFNLATRAAPFESLQIADIGDVAINTFDLKKSVEIIERHYDGILAHGTPFRRAVEEGLIDPERTVQIGLRGTGYAADEFDGAREQGFMVVPAEACWHQSLTPLMAEVRARLLFETLCILPGMPRLPTRQTPKKAA